MIVLGLLLVLAGVLVALAAVFSTDGTATMLGNELTALTIFLLGLGSGLAVLWGYAVVRFGTRRTLQRRREHRQLTELSQKLERVEADRRDGDRGGDHVRETDGGGDHVRETDGGGDHVRETDGGGDQVRDTDRDGEPRA